MSTTTHPTLTAFPAVSSKHATTLILGSMPGVASLNAQKYYAHPQNAFWYIMHSIFGAGSPIDTYTDKIDLVNRSGIALWDVLSECKRPGSLDSRIDRKSIKCNNFGDFFEHHPALTLIAFNGKTAEQLYRKHVLPILPAAPDVSLVCLPSSSPAMAMMTRDEKTNVWRRLLQNS